MTIGIEFRLIVIKQLERSDLGWIALEKGLAISDFGWLDLKWRTQINLGQSEPNRQSLGNCDFDWLW